MSVNPPPPEVRWCRSVDGVDIAWSSTGRGPALVKTPNWLNHLSLDATSPVWRQWIARMAQRRRLVRYDARGCGLSDRSVAPDDFARHQDDLRAVVDAAGLDRFALYGASQGAAIAIEFAACHPERVSHLMLCGAYLQGALRRGGSPAAQAEALALLKLVEIGWGRANPAFRQVFAAQFIPDSTAEQQQAFEELQRRTVSADHAAALLRSFYGIDVRAHAAAVRCPTLVLHAVDDARIPLEEGRRVAAAIPGARFVALASRNHILLPHEPAWAQFFALVDDFLGNAPRGLEGLTPAESRVLDRIAAGWANGQIAQALGIAPKTVRNHINRIFDKLGVDGRAQAIVRARDAGLGR